MENFIKIILLEKKRSIEANNKTSDNKAYHIRSEKIELVNSLITSKRIQETEKLEALKIVGIKKLND